MQNRSLALVTVVLLTLLVGGQLAFTTVGQPFGERWTPPVEAVSVSTADDAEITAVVAAGDVDGGVVSWIARSGDRYRVTFVRVDVIDGEVRLGPRRTVTSDAPELRGVAVAIEGDHVALTWERALANDIVLYRTTTGGARVVSDDPLRVAEPSVALVDGGAVVAWQQWSGTGFGVQVAGVAEDTVAYRSMPVSTGGFGSPSVSPAADGFALTWFDGGLQTTETAFGRLTSDELLLSEGRSLGPSRPAGGFGGGTGQVAMDADASGTVVRGVWLDIGTVTTGGLVRDGPVSEVTTFGRGDRPRIALRDERWLAAWVVTGREADSDVAFAASHGEPIAGVISRYASSANSPSPFYAPDAAVAWTERGADSRVFVSGMRRAPDRRYLARLTAEPGRIAFIALAAAVVGVVTIPIMPWIFLSLLGGFYLSNRFVRQRLIRFLVGLSALGGAGSGRQAVRERLEASSPIIWAGVFASGEVGLLLLLLPQVGGSVPLSFAGAAPISVAAALGTAMLQLVGRYRSPWRLIFIFLYLQNAALWATALPAIL